MTLAQIDSKIADILENDPDDIAMIRYWTGYRDATTTWVAERIALRAERDALKKEMAIRAGKARPSTTLI